MEARGCPALPGRSRMGNAVPCRAVRRGGQLRGTPCPSGHRPGPTRQD